MSELTSTKPYLVRALHEWCVDNGMTPHLLVEVDAETRVPVAYVKNGEIVLNLNYSATRDLHIGNEAITFAARFGGVSHNLYVPMSAVRGVFARENGQGMFFQPEEAAAESSPSVEVETVPSPDSEKKSGGGKKPSLKLVK
ncbi:MAG TPA: ClpXP protease specificity-enhancing factor [Methylophilaceae bacterium]|nr:ClpXP protease specificity-enhancing factor [Methylophilaceae bacterium]